MIVRLSTLLPVFLVLGKKQLASFMVWVLVALLGVLSGYGEATLRHQRLSVAASGPMTPSAVLSQNTKALFRTTGWSTSTNNQKWRAPAIVLSGKHLKRGDGIQISGKGRPPEPGQLFASVLKISTPHPADLPGMFDYRLFLAGRGLKWQGKIIDDFPLPQKGVVSLLYTKFLNPVRTDITKRLKFLMPPLEASMATAVLLGAKDKTSRAASNPFADLGLAHLFAVSGLHVGVLLGLFLLPGKLMGISGWQRWFFLLLILPPYALLTGLPGSVVRAAGLAIIASGAIPLGRKAKPLHFLGFLFWATTIWFPGQVLDTGVRLSYSAAAGILAFSAVTRNVTFPRKGLRGFILGGLFISLTAQWATLPLAASSFGRISLVSPLANLLAVPAFGIGVWLAVLALVGSTLPFGLGAGFASLAWVVFRALAGIVKFTDNQTGGWNAGMTVPLPHTILFWIAGSGAVFFWLRRLGEGRMKGRQCLFQMSLIVILISAVFSNSISFPFSKKGPEVWQFDVGQGDCSVVVFPDGWIAMIDTAGRFGFSGKDKSGPLSRNLLPWLARHGHNDFDAVLLTHGHLDHTGGAASLRTDADVGSWFGAGKALKCLLPDTTGLVMKRPLNGETLHQWKNWSLEVSYPLAELPGHLHENDLSLVVALKNRNETQYLWSGDLEKAGEALLLAGPGVGGVCRVWKAGHHGSNTSGSQPFLNAIKPELIVISCGAGNGYKHPSHDYYIVSGDTVNTLRTDLEGSVHFHFKESGEIYWESRNSHGHLPASP